MATKKTKETAPPPHEMGHNNPPLEEQLRLQYLDVINRVEPLAERANKLPKQIASEEDLAIITPVVVDAKKLAGDLEKLREAEKKPFLDKGREVDAFFTPMRDRMKRIATVFENLASEFQRAKAQREQAAADERARIAEAEAEKHRKKADAAKRADTVAKHEIAAEQAEDAASREAAAGKAAAEDALKIRTSAGTARGTKFWNFEIEEFDKVSLDDIRPFLSRDTVEKAIRAKIKIQKGDTKIGGVRVFEDVKASIR